MSLGKYEACCGHRSVPKDNEGDHEFWASLEHTANSRETLLREKGGGGCKQNTNKTKVRHSVHSLF